MTFANPFSLFAIAAILFFWSRAILRYKDRVISFWEFLMWSAVWLAALVVVARPEVTGAAAERLGIGRGSDVVVYVSIIILFYLLFRIYIKLDILERQITNLVRALAIQEAQSKESSTKH